MKVLIVDDEELARQRLRLLVEDDGGHTVIGEAANGQEALRRVQELRPDVVLLDIRMPGMSGIETARHLDALDEPPAVIFTTAYDQYAIEAFDARAIGYVLKPVRRERLQKALEHAVRLGRRALADLGATGDEEPARSHVCARIGNELKLIPVEEILYFQADQKYVRVHHRQGDNLIDDSLKLLESEFGDRFVRIHRSALVSVAHIQSLEKTPDGLALVRLRGEARAAAGDSPLHISRRHLADVRRRLKGR